MTQFFNHPCEYHDTKFKSELEANFALFLDALALKWEYEKYYFKMETGEGYIPDFYIPKLKLWIEVRGYHEVVSWSKAMRFADMIKANQVDGDYLLITDTEASFYENDNLFGTGYAGKVEVNNCPRCNSYVFFGAEGSYKCRSCGFWDGDTLGHGSSSLSLQKGFAYCDKENGAIWMCKKEGIIP